MSELKFAQETVRKAWQTLIAKNHELSISSKEGGDLVTSHDLFIQEFIVKVIRGSRYNFPILAEESFSEKEVERLIRRGSFWSLDPIDGTTNYSFGFPYSAISLALVLCGEVVVGVVFNFNERELFWAEKGKGAFLNGEQINVCNNRVLKEAFVGVDIVEDEKTNGERGERLFRHLKGRVDQRKIRVLGSSALGICDVARGRFGAYICVYTPNRYASWDFDAARLILEEAGGRFSGFKGEDKGFWQTDRLVSNGLLHKDLVKICRGV